MNVAAGADHACALTGGAVQCWGVNTVGQLGNSSADTCWLGNGSYSCSQTPVTASGIIDATAISTGNRHTCALLSGGTLQCWGANESGQLGNGTTTNSAVPVSVPGISNVLAVANGAQHTCAVLSGGAIQCWGDNTAGELGIGITSATTSLVPVTVVGITDATAVTSGLNDSCAVLSSGTVRCWGYNRAGQLGNGFSTLTGTNSSVPVEVHNMINGAAVAAGISHTCALLTSGTVQCWGANESGELGMGTISERNTVPVTVVGF